MNNFRPFTKPIIGPVRHKAAVLIKKTCCTQNSINRYITQNITPSAVPRESKE